MKRHPSLRDLSVDHHHALVQAQRLQRAAPAGSDARRDAAAEFLTFWRQDGQRHFCEEEQVLLPFFARWGNMDQEPIARMLREHALIRRDASRLAESESPDEALCGTLGKQLEEHVRLEERVVFPLIESALSGEALSDLERRLSEFYGENSSKPNGEDNAKPNP